MKELIKNYKGDISLFAITMVLAIAVGLITASISDDKVNIVALSAMSGIAVTLGIDNLAALVGMKLGSRESSAFGVMMGVIIMLLIF